MRPLKTKRLIRFNFGLHLGAFRLRRSYGKFTYKGLYVYACGLLLYMRVNGCTWAFERDTGLYRRFFRTVFEWCYNRGRVGEWRKRRYLVFFVVRVTLRVTV